MLWVFLMLLTVLVIVPVSVECMLYTRYQVKCFPYIISFKSSQLYEVGALTISNLMKLVSRD